jgi:hypothetical protein
MARLKWRLSFNMALGGFRSTERGRMYEMASSRILENATGSSWHQNGRNLPSTLFRIGTSMSLGFQKRVSFQEDNLPPPELPPKSKFTKERGTFDLIQILPRIGGGVWYDMRNVVPDQSWQ